MKQIRKEGNKDGTQHSNSRIKMPIETSLPKVYQDSWPTRIKIRGGSLKINRNYKIWNRTTIDNLGSIPTAELKCQSKMQGLVV